MLKVFLHSLKGASIILTFMFFICLAISLLEQNEKTYTKFNKMLQGNFAPLFGAALGVVPQCGFSAIATKLYVNQNIKIGTLFAVFISTSDEALPILIANPDKVLSIVPLVVTKFIYGFIIGYLFNFLYSKFSRKQALASAKFGNIDSNKLSKIKIHNEDKQSICKNVLNCENVQTYEILSCDNEKIENSKAKKIANAKKNIFHSLKHSLSVAFWVFVVNFVIGALIFYIGQEQVVRFLLKDSIFQPFVVAMFGLLPNCAISVILTQTYVVGGLSLGSLIGGLTVNAGVGLVILFKENKKNIAKNISIVGVLYLLGSLLGFVFCLVQRAIG